MDKKRGPWKLVKVSDLPVPSAEELEAMRCCWVGRQVRFFIGDGQWRKGMVYTITKCGGVKIAVKRGGAWVHNRVIGYEYIPRVLRLASER